LRAVHTVDRGLDGAGHGVELRRRAGPQKNGEFEFHGHDLASGQAADLLVHLGLRDGETLVGASRLLLVDAVDGRLRLAKDGLLGQPLDSGHQRHSAERQMREGVAQGGIGLRGQSLQAHRQMQESIQEESPVADRSEV
jgi:hypothetical protein